MSESNATELIKYLTEDSLKLMYGRLNRRYVVVDALPSVDSLEPADKNVIYVVKETVGKAVRYWPNVLDNDAWKPFGIGQADLDGKADKVDAVEGHLVVSDGNGDLVDADIMPGTFVALALDPSESVQPHATDLRKIWKAYQSGMPVALLDNRPDGTGLYAQLNAAGYTWADGDHMAEYLAGVDDDNRQCDGTVHGYRTESDGVVKFYEDAGHTVEIVPENGKLYCDDTVPDRERVYCYDDGFVRALRFVQFSCNELVDDDPVWPSRRATRQVFYRMTEPYGSSSPDGFEVAYGESTADIHEQMVTGARIGEGKLLPVDDGVIVLPKLTAVNDGKLTITVGESEPVVFTANDSADREVDIPVATDEVAGLVRIASVVDPSDADAAITSTAVLGELYGYVQKVGDATAGHIAVLTSGGSVSDSGISSTDVESAVGHDHTHGNKSILDGVTAPYTTEEQAKLAGIEAGAEANLIEEVQVNGTALSVSDKTVNIQLASGNTAGVVTGEERATWNSWLSGYHSILVSGVNIGGRTYSIVKINNRIWMAENLAYNVAGNSADSATASYGKLYSRDALSQIPIPSGWRIPNESDVLDLCGSSSASAPYRATTWSNGTNTTEFTAQPSGYIDNGTTYSSSCELWTSKSEGRIQYYIEITDSSGTNKIRYVHGGAAYNYWMGIRLVRNVQV